MRPLLLLLLALALASLGLAQRLRLVPQVGHSGAVFGVALTSDGKRLITGGWDYSAKLWDVATGDELLTFAGHTDCVASAVLSPDNRTLATGSWDGTAKLWNAATGRSLHTLSGHRGQVWSVAFSPDGGTIATGGIDGSIRLWSVASGRETRAFSGSAAISTLAWSPNGKTIATGGFDNLVRLWDVASGKPVRELAGHTARVWSVRFSPDGRTLASAGTDGTTRLWDESNGHLKRVLVGHGRVFAVAFSPDGQTLATGGLDGKATLWLGSGKQLRVISAHPGSVIALAFSRGGRSLATGSLDTTAKLWNVENGRPLQEFGGHAQWVTSVAMSSDERILAIGRGRGTGRIWNLAKGEQTEALNLNTGESTTVVVSPDAKTIAIAGGLDVDWLDEATGRQFRFPSGHTAKIVCVALSPDGRTIATGSNDKTIRLFDKESGRNLAAISTPSSVWEIAFSPDGTRLLTGGEDKDARLWQLPAGTPIKTISGHESSVRSVAFSPDGRTLATGSFDMTARLWDAESGRLLHTLVGHKNEIFTLGFSSNGQTLATGSSDTTAKLWDVASGTLVRTMAGSNTAVNSLSFMAGPGIIATGCDNGTTVLWQSKTGRELCVLIPFNDGTWAVTDPEGRYDASHGGDVDGLHWVLDGTEPIALDQLKADYYEPGLLAKIWKGEPLRKVKPLNETDIRLPPEAGVAIQNGKAVVTLTDRGGGIGPTDVSLDGALVHREPKPKTTSKTYRFAVDLASLKRRLVPGQENRLTVVGHTFDPKARPDRPDYLAGRTASASVPVPKAIAAEPPRLFVLACGASDYAGTKLDLRYAAKDAIDLSRELTRAAVAMVGKDRVLSTLLASDAEHSELRPATRKNLLAALADIRARAKATDIVVLYLSGHGVAAGSGERDYYYVCADADDATPGTALFPTVTLSGRQIADALAGMNAAKRVVILDTCASGEFGKREGGTDIRRAWEAMKDRSGTYVLAGCAADAVSYESSRYNQGLLTYALIEAMKANDGVWTDGLLDVQKWLAAAEAAVPRLVEESQIEGVQRPEFKAGRDARDFYVGRLTADDRKTIALASPLPILLPAGNVRDEDDLSDEDTLGLRARIDALLLSRSSRGRGQGYALWRTAAQPGAYRFNVRYQKSGTATVSLVRFPKDPKAPPEPVATFTVTASPEGLPEVVLAEALRRIADGYRRLG